MLLTTILMYSLCTAHSYGTLNASRRIEVELRESRSVSPSVSHGSPTRATGWRELYRWVGFLV